MVRTPLCSIAAEPLLWPATPLALVFWVWRSMFVPVSPSNPNYNIAQVGFITRWTPVKNLTFSADFTWTHIDSKFQGTVSAPSTALFKPAGTYVLGSADTGLFLLRAQRNW